MALKEVKLPDEWIEHMGVWLEDKRPNTVKAYTRHIKKLYMFLVNNEYTTDFPKIRFSHLKKFGTYVKENEVPSNRRPLIAAVKSFWKYLLSDEIVDKNVAFGLKIPKQTAMTTRERKITPEQVKDIFSHVEKWSDLALLSLLYYGGLRISEAVKVKKEDFVVTDDTFSVDVVGKGEKYRRVELNNKARENIEKYMGTLKEKNSYLFPGQKDNTHICADTGARRIKKIVKDAGHPHVTCHYFRHGIATHLLQSGVDIGSVSKMLGHASISTTSLYIHKKDGCLTENID